MLGPRATDDDLEARHLLARLRSRLAGVDEPARVGSYRIHECLGVQRGGVTTYLARGDDGRRVHLAVLRVENPERRRSLLAAADGLVGVLDRIVDGDCLCLVTPPEHGVAGWLGRAAAAR